MTQALVVYLLRTEKIPFIRSNPSLVYGLSVAAMILVSQVIPYIPQLNEALGCEPPYPMIYAFLISIAVAYTALVSSAKVIYLWVFGDWM